MKVHVLTHVPFEGLAAIEDWLREQQAEVSFTRFYQDAALPSVEGLDLVIAMGGPMSVNDESELPWLVAEKAFVREAITAGAGFLGVCLGAQLLASALGARVYQGAHKEIGWFPVTARPAPRSFVFPAQTVVFHWHGETFDLPPGAQLLASSSGCEHQAFQVGERAIGLQFHLEMTPASVASISQHCADEIVEGPYIQDAPTMAAGYAEWGAATRELLAHLLAYLTRK